VDTQFFHYVLPMSDRRLEGDFQAGGDFLAGAAFSD
jgi:hypothetical protein